MANQQTKPATVPMSESEMLDAVHRHLVQIHAAMAEWTSGDREIKPWAQRELMGVMARSERSAAMRARASRVRELVKGGYYLPRAL